MRRSPTNHDLLAAEATRLGEALREARLALGASVDDISARLRIHRRYLQALEEGRIKDLPGPAYVLGFLRAYATALGLDADDMVWRLRDATGGVATRSKELVFPEPVPSRGVPAIALIAAGVIIAGAAYLAWSNWSGLGERSVDTVPPLPEALERVVQAGPPRGEESTRSETSPLAEARREPLPAPGEQQATAVATTPSAERTAAPLTAPPAVPEPAAAPPLPREGRIILRARGESWVQVRDSRTNQVIFDRVLRGGETWPVPAREGLVLTTGRAENLEIVVDGAVSQVLAGVSGVRRGILLDPDRLRAAAEAPAPPRP